MGGTLSSRLDTKELVDLQASTAFTRDELLELYSQFRYLSDNQKTITRAQFEMGLASVGIGPGSPHNASRQSSVASTAGGGEVEQRIESILVRAPTDEDLSALHKMERIAFRLYDVLYEQAHGGPAPANPADDKGLSFDSFCAALSTLVSPRPQEQIETLFRLFDESGDDYISEGELTRALMAVGALLELPEISTDHCDSPAEAHARIKVFAAEVISKYGRGGKLTLPQFRAAVASHPALADVGQKIVTEACGDFFHAGPAKSPASSSAHPSPAVQSLIPPPPPTGPGRSPGLLGVSATDGRSSPMNMSRRGSFLAAPPTAVAFVMAKEADQQEEGPLASFPSAAAVAQPPLHQCSLSHVVVHCYPQVSKQQISFIAQRHRAEFHHRPEDRYMHLVLVATAAELKPAELAAMHKEFLHLVGGDVPAADGTPSRTHVAVKPVTVKDPAAGITDDAFRGLLLRFLDANPSNIVRLPYHLRSSETAELTTKFSDLALMVGHGFPLVTPETAPTAVVRRMRNYVFCAEKSKASERAARLLGTMVNPRYRDLCVVETLWNVSMSSVGHALDDNDAKWRLHLKGLRERALKVAEHFRAKVAYGIAWSQTAAQLNVSPADVVKDDPKAAAIFTKAHDAAIAGIGIGAAEESEWDASVVKMLQRVGLIRRPSEMAADHQQPKSETVFVVGFQSRTMARKFYAATMAFLHDSTRSHDVARQSVGFVFVN